MSRRPQSIKNISHFKQSCRTENAHHKHFITSIYGQTLILKHVLNAIPVRWNL
jgi:hypothetical protein